MVTQRDWRQFPVLVLECEFEMRASFQLPPFAGSLFRGVLGWALKSLTAPGDYSYLFETEADGARPFVLLPPQNQRSLKSGDRFSLQLHLLGRATDYAETFVQAWQEAGRLGLGPEEAGFELVWLRTRPGAQPWSDCSGRLPLASTLGDFLRPWPPQVEEICLEFVTPTRLIFREKPAPLPALLPA